MLLYCSHSPVFLTIVKIHPCVPFLSFLSLFVLSLILQNPSPPLTLQPHLMDCHLPLSPCSLHIILKDPAAYISRPHYFPSLISLCLSLKTITSMPHLFTLHHSHTNSQKPNRTFHLVQDLCSINTAVVPFNLQVSIL